MNNDAPIAAEVVSGGTRADKLRRVAVEESKDFLAIFVYLAVVFGVFVLHGWVVLASEHISYRFYGAALINALVLAKIFLVADKLHFARQLDASPLVVPILYKSAAFTLLLIVAYIGEEMLLGHFHGKTLAESMPRIGDGSVKAWLVTGLIVSIALIPFFAHRELSRTLGANELRGLILGRG
jgi:hypothetical protein